MNFDGISFSFIVSTLGGISVGVAMIYFSQEIADITGGFFSTHIIRDLDRPYVYKVVGALLIISNLFIFGSALFN